MLDLTTLLAPFKRIPPVTAQDADAVLDHLIALKEMEPANLEVDAALRGMGELLCDFQQPIYQS